MAVLSSDTQKGIQEVNSVQSNTALHPRLKVLHARFIWDE